jgi:electron transfer flavoprotein alpha subunit
MTTLVFADHNHQTLSPATLSAIAAAQKIGGDVHLLLAGHNLGSVTAVAGACAGVQTVLVADNTAYQNFLAEPVAELIAHLVKASAGGYTHILSPATSHGKNILPRAAGLCRAPQISDITGVVATDTFTRPIYAGNAIATVKTSANPVFITVRSTAFAPVAATGGTATVSPVSYTPTASRSVFVGAELSTATRPDLTAAKIVVSGGRGMGSAENFKNVLEPLADKLGAALGASRAAVDAGYVPNDYQVGQTGKIVAPQLYIAVGISGAIQHLAGMKDSKVIVAINKDPDAPIFQVADYGLVADLFTTVPELCEKL